MKYNQARNIQTTKMRVTFDGTNPVKIPSIASMTGIVIDTLATNSVSGILKIEADFPSNVAKVYSAPATGSAASLPAVKDIASAGIFKVQTLYGTFTVATNAAKVTLSSQALASAIPVGTALTVDGEGSGLQPIFYVQSVSGADLILGYSSVQDASAKPVVINILGIIVKDKIMLDGKMTIAGPSSYFVSSLPAEIIKNQVNLIVSDRKMNGVKFLVNFGASLQKSFTITDVDVATGKYYFDATDEPRLKNNGIILGAIHFQPGFTYIHSSIQDKSIYKDLYISKDALQPGDALISIESVTA